MLVATFLKFPFTHFPGSFFAAQKTGLSAIPLALHSKKHLPDGMHFFERLYSRCYTPSRKNLRKILARIVRARSVAAGNGGESRNPEKPA